MSTDTHTEERDRLEDELRRIDATLSNGWIETKPKRLAALTERRIEVMDSLAAMDADESIANPDSDSNPLGDDWEDVELDDWILKGDVKITINGDLIPVDHNEIGKKYVNDIVQVRRRKPTSATGNNHIDAAIEVVRELNIDTDYQMKKALTFAKSLIGSNRQAALLVALRKAKVDYSKAIEAAVKAAGMEPA